MRTPAIDPKPPEYPTSQLKMYPLGSASSRHGWMRMPTIPVIRPPVLKLIHLGKALAKSLAGETTLAAILTASVATTAVNIEMAITRGWLNLAINLIGSQITSP